MDNRKKSIKNWPADDKPREKLLKHGEHRLSDTELLAILLRTGVRGESALELARKIIGRFGSFRNMSHNSILKWKGIKGLGEAKICQVKAALEIGRRFTEETLNKESYARFTGPQDAVRMMMFRMRDLKNEVFKVIHLDSKNRIIEETEHEEGTVNQANPIIREVFRKAMENFASSVICLHNHPSGDPSPSREDREFTKSLMRAGETLNIKVLDHIIIGDNSYYSFAEHGFEAG
jgi:DNA repair protein RadC